MRNVLTIAAASIAMAVGASAQAQTKWDLPSAYPAQNFHVTNMNQFAKDIAAGSGGKLNITVHPAASLYKAPEIKRAVQGNQVQIGEIILVNFGNEDPIFELDGIPFLAKSYDDARKLYNAQKPALEKKLASQGMMLLYAVPWPPQGIYANKKLNSVADMKGLKMRVYSPATSKLAELVGAQPVTIQAAELAQAMATGVANANITSGVTGVDTKAWEYTKNYHDTQAWLPKNAVIVNKKAFDALDKNTQAAILKAAADAESRGWRESFAVTAKANAELARNGIDVITPSPELTKGLNDIGERMLADWLKKAGPNGKAIIDVYRQP